MLEKHMISKLFPLLLVTFLTCCSSKNTRQKFHDIRQEPIKEYCEAKTPEERFNIEDQYAYSDWTQQVLPIVTADYSNEIIKVVVADNKEFKNAFYEKISYGQRIQRGFCVPGKENYYRIYVQKMFDLFDEEPCDALDGYKLDKEGSFTVEPNLVRFCNIAGMKNVRDLGGWNTASGKRINYQKLYRGANFLRITDQGKYEFTQTLGIKTEIDLREKGDRPDRNLIENQKLSTLGKGYNVTYVEAPIVTCSYIYPQFKQEEPVKRSYYTPTKASLFNAFTTLSDESNYPIYFHCNAGADRTGTFAFLVEALLGVSIDDLCLDYELTCFSTAANDEWRGPYIPSANGRVLGTAKDDSQNYCAFGPLIDNMLKWYGISNGAKDDTLSSAVENYLTSFIGITEEQIQSIKNILLD